MKKVFNKPEIIETNVQLEGVYASSGECSMTSYTAHGKLHCSKDRTESNFKGSDNCKNCMAQYNGCPIGLSDKYGI